MEGEVTKNKNNRKKIKIIAIIILVMLAIGGGVFGVLKVINLSSDSDKTAIYVSPISDYVTTNLNVGNRYMGVVESQEQVKINKDADKVIKEVYVEEGQKVSVGDRLFEYDTDELDLKLQQMGLELQGINNSISTLNTDINNLVTERNQAPEDEKLYYTTQIQSLQAQLNQEAFDASSKQLEIDRQKASIQNTVVTSTINGTIKSINKPGDNQGNTEYEGSGEGTDDAYITIVKEGDFRIKATVNEMNVSNLSEGMTMKIRSRVDETLVWTGTVEKVDVDNPNTSDNSNMDSYGGMGSGENSSTNYTVYIKLNEHEGLILGQHVYVEEDYGFETVEKEGLWLTEFLLINENDKYYVWVENSKGKIEKREIKVGEYDENMMEYEILEGLKPTDYIAFPEESITEGAPTTRNFVYPEDGMMEEDMMLEDGMMEEEGSVDEGIDSNGEEIEEAQ